MEKPFLPMPLYLHMFNFLMKFSFFWEKNGQNSLDKKGFW
jgi:hypothetical protein